MVVVDTRGRGGVAGKLQTGQRACMLWRLSTRERWRGGVAGKLTAVVVVNARGGGGVDMLACLHCGRRQCERGRCGGSQCERKVKGVHACCVAVNARAWSGGCLQTRWK